MGYATITGGSTTHKFQVYGHSETVTAGNGNDTIIILGQGSVIAGNGNDEVLITKTGHISVGSGQDTLTLLTGGSVTQTGAHGTDTINLGTGNVSIFEQGSATVVGTGAYNSFGNATIYGGSLQVTHEGGLTIDTATGGKVTVQGGSHAPTEFVGSGSGTFDFVGKSGSDTFVGGTGHDTLAAAAGTGNNVFDIDVKGGTHTIVNFVSTDSLFVLNESYSALYAAGDIKYDSSTNTSTITYDNTTITLKGFDIEKHPNSITTTENKH